MKGLACAFTGHRPDRFSFGYDEADEKCLKIKALMSEWIAALIKSGVTTFYTGMALGIDQWAASIVLDMKQEHLDVRLIAVLPCETQANRWSEQQRGKYYDTLALCDDVITLNNRYTRSCMFERNRYLVNHSDFLLAVYDGGEKGGTAYTVKYGRQKKRQIITIHPDTLEIVSSVDIDVLHRRKQFKILNGNDE